MKLETKISPRLSLRTFRFLAAALIGMASAQCAEASFIQIVPASSVLAPGQSTSINVNFTSTQNFFLQSADLAIMFDSTRFSISNVSLGTLTTGFASFFGTPTANELTTSSAAPSAGTQITSGQSGSLLTFTLTALANAPLGGSQGNINLQAVFGNTVTSINEGQIALTPPPTNGFDTGVDGTVIVGAVVPEPASLVLVGLGGGLTFLTVRFRNRSKTADLAIAA